MRRSICALLVLLAAVVNAQTTVSEGFFTYTSPAGFKKTKGPASLKISLIGSTEKGIASNIGLVWAPTQGYSLKVLADQVQQAMTAKPGNKVIGTESAKMGGKEARIIYLHNTAKGTPIKQAVAVAVSGSDFVGIILTTEASVFPTKLAAFKPTLKTVKWK